jgi:hypothetical protein
MRTTAAILVFVANVGGAAAAPTANELDGSRIHSGELRPDGSSHSQFIVERSDTDGDNSKNPALPGYERGRGHETGGYERNLIPD